MDFFLLGRLVAWFCIHAHFQIASDHLVLLLSLLSLFHELLDELFRVKLALLFDVILRVLVQPTSLRLLIRRLAQNCIVAHFGWLPSRLSILDLCIYLNFMLLVGLQGSFI